MKSNFLYEMEKQKCRNRDPQMFMGKGNHFVTEPYRSLVGT